MEKQWHLFGPKSRSAQEARRRFRPTLDGLEARVAMSAAPVEAPPAVEVTTQQVDVFAVPVRLSVKRATWLYGQPVQLEATLRRRDTGVVIPDQPITFAVDGVIVGLETTDSKGVAKLSLAASDVDQFNAGHHRLTATYLPIMPMGFKPGFGANQYVVTRTTSRILAEDTFGETRQTIDVSAKLVDRYSGAGIPDQTVSVRINKRFYRTVITDGDGEIAYRYYIPQKYTHIVEYFYHGNVNYAHSRGRARIIGTVPVMT